MNREIDLFANQPIQNTPQNKEEIPTIPRETINHTELKAFYDVFAPEKEIKIYLVGRGTVLFQANGGKKLGKLLNHDGLRCFKVLDEKGKQIQNCVTGKGQFESLEHFHLDVGADHPITHPKGKTFSAYSRDVKRTTTQPKK